MPLTFCKDNELVKVVRVSGTQEARKHLEDMGFAQDATIRVVSSQNGNVIVNVKDTRVALGQNLASKITVAEV